MLSALGTKLETFTCADEIDEIVVPEKNTDALSKANKDYNMTEGLEAKLVPAVVARVMF